MQNPIYKYLNVSDCINTISNSRVVFNKPKNFNDPFDTQNYYSKKEENRTEEIIKNYAIIDAINYNLHSGKPKFNKYISSFNKGLNSCIKYAKRTHRFAINDRFLAIINNLRKNDPDFAKEIDNFGKRMVRKYKEEIATQLDRACISCFSKINNSILMWSHYADKHKGACIEFEIQSNSTYDFYEVVYEPEREPTRISTLTEIYFGYKVIDMPLQIADGDAIKIYADIFRKKYTDWAYEKEVRALKLIDDDVEKNRLEGEQDKYLLEIPAKIKRVYLGCKMSSKDENSIRKICKEKHIPVTRMKEKIENYSVFPKK